MCEGIEKMYSGSATVECYRVDALKYKTLVSSTFKLCSEARSSAVSKTIKKFQETVNW